MTASLDKMRFSSEPMQQSVVYRRLAEMLTVGNVATVLEIGCGTGARLAELALRFPRIRFVGIDFSDQNIAAARSRSSAVEWRLVNYLSASAGRFDIICGDSVLHLIDCTDHELAKKLATDLLPGGVLLATMPYDCTWNRTLIGVRYLLRAARCRALDRTALWAAKQAYPHWEESALMERVEYLYVVPTRMDHSGFRATMAKCGLRVTEVVALHSPSLAKPKHRLLVFERSC